MTWFLILSLLAASAHPAGAEPGFVAVRADGKVFVSEKGGNWVQKIEEQGNDLGDFYPAEKVVWGAGVWVTSGERSYYSKDGEKWEGSRQPGQRTYAIAAGEPGFLVLRRNGGSRFEAGFSEDGNRFNTVNPPEAMVEANEDMRSIAFGNGVFAAASIRGDVYVTERGENWKSASGVLENTETCRILFGAGKFLLLGGDRHAVSEDGLHWKPLEIDPKQPVPGYSPKVWTGDRFLIVLPDAGLAYQSRDGLTWEKSEIEGKPPRTGKIAFFDGKFVGLGWGDDIVTSDDGKVWKETRPMENASDFSRRFLDVASREN